MNNILCWLTGGHRYSDSNLISVYSMAKKQMTFVNSCVKCGKAYAIKILDESIEILIKMGKDGNNDT